MATEYTRALRRAAKGGMLAKRRDLPSTYDEAAPVRRATAYGKDDLKKMSEGIRKKIAGYRPNGSGVKQLERMEKATSAKKRKSAELAAEMKRRRGY